MLPATATSVTCTILIACSIGAKAESCVNDLFSTDATCLLQSYIVPKVSKRRIPSEESAQAKSPLHNSKHQFTAALLSSAASTSHASALDTTTGLLVGVLLLVILAAIAGLAFVVYNSRDEKDYDDDHHYALRYAPQEDVHRYTPQHSPQHSQHGTTTRSAPHAAKIESYYTSDAGTPGYLPRASSGTGTMPRIKLNSSLVVSADTVYNLPDVSQQRKNLEAYSVLHKNGQQALGVIVKFGDDDPGILLHGPSSGGGAGVPMAFIATNPEAIRTGQLRIAQPSPEHPRGRMFGTLEPDGDAFKVMCEGQLLLWIQGGSQRYTLTSGMKGSGQVVGATVPEGDNLELRLKGGADTALAVICVLVVMQLSAST
jgi:hypothetical protein